MNHQTFIFLFRSRILHFVLMMLIFACLQANAAVKPDGRPDERIGGTVTATIGEKTVHLPLMKTDISADIQGDLASVTVTQTFSNPTGVPLNATYLFPLNKNAAVYAMQMQIGDEIVTAEIKKKQEAKQIFDTAKREGKAASLLVQHRPNMFTQSIANLMPGSPVTITLKYTHAVPRQDGDYQLVLPLIVGPRYHPAQPASDQVATHGENSPEIAAGKWRVAPLPNYPDVAGLNLPDNIDRDRVSIRINLTSAVDLLDMSSPTHAIESTGGKRSASIILRRGATLDNRDFVLRYRLAGQTIGAGILVHKDQRGGFFSLLLEPPKSPTSDAITPREMVFVLDTSGSMSGLPMAASKTFMRAALKSLQPTDTFRIVRFGSDSSEFSSRPLLATEKNLKSGHAYVDGLSTGGGTNIPLALERAFGAAPKENMLRVVVFLSDGYVGNEAEILKLIAGIIGEARIYAFGVGQAVNHYLLAEMARQGRGFSRTIGWGEDAHAVARQLAHRLEAPVLTDIDVDWGTLKVQSVAPDIIPDLFAGQSLRLQGRFEQPGTHRIVVRGKVNGQPAALPLDLDLDAIKQTDSSNSIALIWAREEISDLMREFPIPPIDRTSNLSDAQIETKVTDLGLRFALSTQWTSFVAVSRKVINPLPELARDANVPLPMVSGVTEKAYGTQQRQASVKTGQQKFTQNFTGGSTPEPPLIIGALILALAGFLGLFRKRSIRS